MHSKLEHFITEINQWNLRLFVAGLITSLQEREESDKLKITARRCKNSCFLIENSILTQKWHYKMQESDKKGKKCLLKYYYATLASNDPVVYVSHVHNMIFDIT